MFRLVLSIAALTCGTAVAAPPADDAQAAQATPLGASKAFAVKPTTATAAPNQLFPPVPGLASLPPSSSPSSPDGDGWDDAPAPSGNHHTKKGHHAPKQKVVAEAPVRMVVSDESHAYLATIDHKLDEALQASPHERRAVTADSVDVAMFH